MIERVLYEELELLNEMVEEGYISKRPHPTEPLFIYNYTAKCSFARHWNAATLQARGLVLDSDGHVIARPFKKFFNLSEHDSEFIPDLNPTKEFSVFNKEDGSLGILFFWKGQPMIATRGSFESDQAVEAMKIYEEKYADHNDEVRDELERSQQTALLEIIYPENRIVVNYCGRRDLILLGIIDNKDGSFADPYDEDFILPFAKTERFDGIKDYSNLKEMAIDNREGFVIVFQNGHRVKVKFDEYVRLHRVMTHISTKIVWDCMSTGDDLDSMLKEVPDEFFNWVRDWQRKLSMQFVQLHMLLRLTHRKCILEVGDDRKAYAQLVLAEHPEMASGLFMLLSKKDTTDWIWAQIKPDWEVPFA